MAEEVGKLTIALSLDNKSFNESVKETENVVTSGFTMMKGVMANLIAQGISAATSAVGNFANSIVTTGMQFDTAMSQVAATMGTTVDQIGDLSAVAKEMGSTTKFTATEAAEGLNILAMAGLDAKEQIAGIPVVLDLASAGALSLESSAEFLVTAVNGFSDSMDNAQYYADLMAKGATLAATDVASLGSALGRSAATAASYGQEADSVTLSLLRLANQSVTGEAAATALNRAMADLYTPTESAAAAMAELGIAAYDSNGAARDFNIVVDELSEALSGMSDEQANAYAATIFTTQGLRAFNMMTVASEEQVNSFREGLENAFGSAAQQAAVQIDNLEGSMTILASSFEGVQLSIYENLKPALLDGANGLLNFAQALASVVNGADPSAFIQGFITKFGNALRTGLARIGTIMGEVGPVIIESLMGLLPELLQGAIDMITNLVNSLSNSLPDLLLSLVDSIINSLLTIFNPENVQKLMEAMKNLLSSLVDAIPEVVERIAEALPQIITGIIDAFTQSQVQIMEAGVELLHGLVDAIPQIVPPLMEALPEIIMTIVTGLMEAVPQIIAAAIELLMAIIQAIPIIIEALVAELPNIVITMVNVLIENIPALMDGAITLLMAIVEAIPILIEALIPMMPTIVATMVTSLIEHAPDLLQGAMTLLMEIVNGITQIVPHVLEAMKHVVGGIVEGLKNGIGAVGEAIGSVGSSIVEGFKSFFGIHSPSTVMADQATYLTAGLVEGLSDMSLSTLDVFNEVSAVTMEWGAQFGELGVEIGTLFIETFLATMETLPEMIMTLFTSVVEYFTTWGTQLVAAMTSTTQQLTTLFTQWSNSMLQQVQNFITQLNNIAKQFQTQSLKWAKEFGEKFKEQMLEEPKKLPEEFERIGVDIIKGVEAGMRRQAPALLAYVDELCAQIVAKFQAAMQIHSPSAVMRDEVGVYLAQGLGVGFVEEMAVVYEQMQGAMDGMPGMSTDADVSIGADVQTNPLFFTTEEERLAYLEAMTSFYEQLSAKQMDTFTKLTTNLNNWVSQTQNKMQEMIKNITNQVKQFGDDLVKKAAEIGKEFSDKLLEEPEKLPEKFKELGIECIKGMEAGMRAQEPALMAYVDDLCARIVAKIRAAMSIHSPSRVMRDEVGIFLAQGIGVGFGEEMEKVNKQMVKDIELPTMAGEEAKEWLSPVLRNLNDDEDERGGVVEGLTVIQNNTIDSQLDIQMVSEALLEEIRRY